MSVNQRSTGPTDRWRLGGGTTWLFWLAPIAGAALAGLAYPILFSSGLRTVPAAKGTARRSEPWLEGTLVRAGSRLNIGSADLSRLACLGERTA